MNQSDVKYLPLTPPKPTNVSMIPFKDTPFTAKTNNNNNNNNRNNNNEGIPPSHTHDHFVVHCGTYFYQEVTIALSEMWEILCIKPFLFAVLGTPFLCLFCKPFCPSFQHTHLHTYPSVNVYLTVSFPYSFLPYASLLCYARWLCQCIRSWGFGRLATSVYVEIFRS